MKRNAGGYGALIGLLLLGTAPLAAQKADTVTTTKRDSVPVYNVTQTITRTITKTVTVHDTVKVPTPPVVTPPKDSTPPVVTPPKDSTPPVVMPPPTAGYPNRPANYTKVLAELDQSQTVPSGSGERYLAGFPNTWSIVGGSGTVTRESDATAPGSPSFVWKVFEKAGCYGADAQSHAACGTPGAGSSTDFGRWGLPINSGSVYGSVWVKWSTGFVFHPISTKFLRMDMVGAQQAFLIQATHNGCFLRSSDEQAGIGIEPANCALPSTGVWHQIEFVAVRGQAGSLKVWYDKQLRVNYAGPMALTGNFATFEIHSDMGGGGMVIPADQSFVVDHVFVAGP